MLRRGVRQHGEVRDGFEEIFGSVFASKVADRGTNRRLVALEERIEKIYLWPFFFAGALLPDARAGVVAVEVMPSPSERLSSISTVCVIGSVPFGAGCAVAGAIVCVVACVLVDGFFACRLQASGTSAKTATSRRILFTTNPRRNPMQFP